ncbi:hypothetical protein [Pseudaminobacter sp. NGMCC 1.201702]|uniref:hypothetical protein n=1 Tax=Pseudaminobacter sp. NGMCC 1.201702 TaxID=3391825 RepID=UPI0039EF3D0A
MDPVADLDAAHASRGEEIVIRRYTATTGTPRPKIDIAVRATVRPMKAEDLVGGIDQTYSKVIVSPTGLSPLLPFKKGDKAVIQGRERNIEFPQPIFDGDRLVRLNLLVAG